MIPGIGIGIGFGGRGLSPAWLESRLVSRLGANLTGLWGIDPPTVAGGVTTAIKARVGADIPGTNTRVMGSANGRPVVSVGEAGGSKWFRLNDGIVGKDWFVVAGGHVLTSNYEVLLYSYNLTGYPFSGAAIVAQSWHGGSGAPYTHYCDGAASEAIPTSGIHVFRSHNSVATYTGLTVGASDAAQVFIGDIGVIVRCAAVCDAGTAAAVSQDLMRYMRVI